MPLGNGEPYGVTATATDLTTGDTSEFSYCRPASSTNLTWPAARTMSSNQTVEQYITDRGQEKWFKVAVNPGDKVKVEVTGQPGTAISLHRDPRPFYNNLVNPSSAAVLSAEAADSGFLPSGFLPSGFLPSGFLPSGLPAVGLPRIGIAALGLPADRLAAVRLVAVGLPAVRVLAVGVPAVRVPAVRLPAVRVPARRASCRRAPCRPDSLPSGFLPSGFLPSGFLPSDAYASASRKSLMAVAQDPVASTQTIERTTFDLQEDLYVRVVGPLDLTNRFTIKVTLSGGACSSLQAVPTATPVFNGRLPANTGRATVIVTDSSRMAGTPAEIATAMASLQTLAGRADVAGAVVDLAPGNYPRVDFANAQAALLPDVPGREERGGRRDQGGHRRLSHGQRLGWRHHAAVRRPRRRRRRRALLPGAGRRRAGQREGVRAAGQAGEPVRGRAALGPGEGPGLLRLGGAADDRRSHHRRPRPRRRPVGRDRGRHHRRRERVHRDQRLCHAHLVARHRLRLRRRRRRRGAGAVHRRHDRHPRHADPGARTCRRRTRLRGPPTSCAPSCSPAAPT